MVFFSVFFFFISFFFYFSRTDDNETDEKLSGIDDVNMAVDSQTVVDQSEDASSLLPETSSTTSQQEQPVSTANAAPQSRNQSGAFTNLKQFSTDESKATCDVSTIENDSLGGAHCSMTSPRPSTSTNAETTTVTSGLFV